MVYHGGKEHCHYPSPRLRKACREMVKCGAAVVLCQHSHCIGCYEQFGGAHILYGQGNFHFCRESRGADWNEGLMVCLDIKNKIDIGFIPVVSGHGSICIPPKSRYDSIMDSFRKRNGELGSGEWRQRWHEFCIENRSMYKKAICGYTEADNEDEMQLFSHYLDCEAHTDVWRELFPTWNSANEK